jgi:zinc protease
MRKLAAVLALAVAPALAQDRAAAPQRATSPSELKFGPLKPIQIPQVETAVLPNGMRLYLLEDHELPIVNGAARVRTGNLFDPADKVGLAGITGAVMRTGGIKAKTGDQLDAELENIAASVEASIGETSGSVSFSALKENTDAVLAIFKEVLTQPEFRQDKIDLAKTQARSAISRRNDDAHGIVQREFSDLVYGKDTPYGWRIEHATIEAIGRADLQAFHQRYFFPANVMLAVWGDFNAAEMKQKIERLFAGWSAKQPPVPAFPKVMAPPQPGAYLAAKDDVTQTFFAMGHMGGTLRDKDYAALEVMADILGGGFRSRLVQRVRTQMGAAYSISANWGANYGHPGLFEITGSTKSMSTVETIRATLDEVNRIRTQEVSQEELDAAKQSTLNSLVFAFDTRTKTLGRMLTYEYWGYPKDFIYQYQKALEAVTRADVLRVAKQYLDPAKFTIMAVGNPAEFGVGLEALGGPVRRVDLTIPTPKPKTARTSNPEGAKLLAAVQKAVGGKDKLAAIHDVAVTAEYQMAAEMGGMKAKQFNRWVAPSFFRQDSELPIGKISAYTNGKTGWIQTPQGGGPLGGAQLRQAQGAVFRNYFRMLASEGYGYDVALASSTQVELHGAGDQMARLTVDENTYMPQRLTHEEPGPDGVTATVEEQFSDFRDVGGVKTPFKITIMRSGAKFAELTIQECKINSGIKAEELGARPQ